MRRYETIVIADPDLSDDDRTSLFDRIKEIIPQQGGVLIQEDPWGAKKLAYEIKKKPRGFYVRFDYCGEGALVDEIERFFRIDDRVMKYLTVQLAAEADVEQIQAAMAPPETAEETPVEIADTKAVSETSAVEVETETPATAESPEAETTTEISEKE
jgi:small subunit ribosomal protein S6